MSKRGISCLLSPVLCAINIYLSAHGPDGEICYGERLPSLCRQSGRTDMPLFLRTDTHIKRGEAKYRDILELGGFVVEFLPSKNRCYLVHPNITWSGGAVHQQQHHI